MSNNSIRSNSSNSQPTSLGSRNLIPDSSVSTQKLADGAVTAAKLGSSVTTFFNQKNWVINSNFDFWQRGTSFTQATLTTGKYHADRFLTQWDGTTTFTISQQVFTVGQTQVPNNPAYFCRANITAASGATVFNIMQRIEDVTKSSGKTFTINFWAKADAARTVTMDCEQVFGTGGSPSSTTDLGIVGTFNLTTSWQQFSTTVTFPNISGKTLGTNNDHYFNFDFDLPINTVCTVDFSQIMMNEGSVAGPYSIAGVTIAGELAACQRYYEQLTQPTVPIYANSTTTGIGAISFKVNKRSTAWTLSNSTNYLTNTRIGGNAGNSASAVSKSGATNNTLSVSYTFPAGTNGAAMNVASISATDFLAAEAEL